jgi:hypothetical protein
MVEQRNAAPEQDVHQVDMYLVEEPCFDALLHDARGTHADVLVACDRLRLLYGAFESVRDERERRSFVDLLLWDRAAEDKDRYVQGVFATPPVGEDVAEIADASPNPEDREGARLCDRSPSASEPG